MIINTIDVHTDTLSYIDAGQGEVTLVFIHGAFINKDYWESQIACFSPEYRVIAVDLAGHGASTKSGTEWTVKRLGNDIAQLLEKLSLEKVILIGHSMGGDVVLEAAGNRPGSVLGLIAVDNFKSVGFELPQPVIDQALADMETDFMKTCEAYFMQALATEKTRPQIVQRVLQDFSMMDPSIGIAFNRDFMRYAKRETEMLKALHHKLHLVNVDYAPTHEDQLKQLMGDNFDVAYMKGTCHYPMIEDPDQLNRLLEKTIDKIKEKKYQVTLQDEIK